MELSIFSYVYCHFPFLWTAVQVFAHFWIVCLFILICRNSPCNLDVNPLLAICVTNIFGQFIVYLPLSLWCFWSMEILNIKIIECIIFYDLPFLGHSLLQGMKYSCTLSCKCFIVLSFIRRFISVIHLELILGIGMRQVSDCLFFLPHVAFLYTILLG